MIYMASITAKRNKKGEIISYQIQVYRGRDISGKKLKPFSMNWKVPEGWKERSIQKELQKIAAEFELNCKAGRVSIEKKTFQQYADYVMQLKKRDTKHRTIFRYEQMLVRINEEIGHLKLQDIKSIHLNKLYMKLSQEGQNKRTGGGLSSKTILNHHRLIHSIFAQAVKEQLLLFNPADSATPPKQQSYEADYFELDELVAIRSALHSEPLKWRTLIELMIATGARRGEILGLQWKSINFNDCELTIENNVLYTPEQGVYADTTKTGESRTISIPPEICKLLRQHKKEQLEWKLKMGDAWEETGYCFTRDNGQVMFPDSINTYLYKFAKKYNLPSIHPHKFRHTQASLLYELGENPVTISKRLGHKQVSTTQDIYSHVLKNSDKKASDKLAEVLYKNA